MNATFRLRKSYLLLGVLSSLFFAAMAVVSVLVIYFEAPAERRAAALAGGLGIAAFWVAFLSLAVWVLLAYWRERLVVRDGEIDCVGVIRRKGMRVPEIVVARWRCGQKAGSLVLRTTSTKLSIYFSNYEAEEQRQLIRFFREAVPPPLQQDWERFCARIVKARPQHARQLRKPEAGEGEVLLTRRRLDAYFLAGMLLLVAAALYVYHATGDASVFSRLLVIPAVWLVVRFLLPRKGAVSKRLTSDPGGRFVLFFYLWLLGGMVVLLVLKAFVPNAALVFMIPFSVITFGGILAWARRLDRRQQREELEAIEQIRLEGRLLPEELNEPWS